MLRRRVLLLRQRGADINARDCHGMTPLMVAARNGQREIVERLLKAGADANATHKARSPSS